MKTINERLEEFRKEFPFLYERNEFANLEAYTNCEKEVEKFIRTALTEQLEELEKCGTISEVK